LEPVIATLHTRQCTWVRYMAHLVILSVHPVVRLQSL